MRGPVALLLLLLLAACQTGDLGPDAFVGRWDCGGTALDLSVERFDFAGGENRIAFIETGKNADFSMTLTDGERFALFDVTRRTMTLVTFADGETYACRRRR